jgi:hypothetical protein
VRAARRDPGGKRPRGADVINLQANTYTLAIPGKNEDSAATGDLDINDTVNGGTVL